MKSTPNERIYRYELMESALRLYKKFNVWWDVKNLCSCSRFSPVKNFTFNLLEDGHVVFYGLNRCHSRSSCPVCAYPAQLEALSDITQAIQIARKKGKGVYLVTYTFAHGAGDQLAIIQTLFAEAKMLLYRNGSYRNFMKSLGYLGRITDYEIQVAGRNGFHPHTHDLEILDEDLDEEMIKDVYADFWMDALEKAGLSAKKEISVDVLGYKGVGEYVTKMGMELTLQNFTKQSYDGRSMSPFQCLAMYHETGEDFYGTYWVEYVCNVKRKRMISWSRGLKHILGVVPFVDEDMEVEGRRPLIWIKDKEQIRKISRANWRVLLETANNGGLNYVLDALDRIGINYAVNRFALKEYRENKDVY